MRRAEHRNREEAARWFARLQNLPEPDHPERGRFERWLAADPAHAHAYAAVAELWDDLGSTTRLRPLAAAAGQAAQQRRTLIKRSALGVLGAMAAGTLGWQLHEEHARSAWQAAWTTAPGQARNELLADGTRLSLAGAGRLDIHYTHPRRGVRRHEGVAAFDVARDATRPFVVDIGNTTLTVLGTRFVVDRLDAERVRVSLAQGRVRVARREAWLWGLLERDLQTWTMAPGQVLEVGAQGGGLVQHAAQDAFAWQRGALVLQDATLHELALALSRHTATPIRVQAGAGTASPRIAAVVQLAHIDAFIDNLPRIAPVQVQRQDGVVLLRAKNL